MENREDIETEPVAQESVKPPESDGKTSGRITFHYIKSNFFRVVHVDGVWGGVTPQADIQMAVFSERRPIPLQLAQEVSAQGELGQPIPGETIVREGIVREVEANLVFNTDIAEAIIKWLQDKLEQLRKIQELQASKQSSAATEERK